MVELAPATDLDHKRHADELRETWQCRVLIATAKAPLNRIVLSILAHNFDDAMPVLLRIAFPGFTGLTPPFLSSAGKIDRAGRVVGDVVTPDGLIVKNMPLFRSTKELETAFRRLADKLKLSDDDRRGMFAAVGCWLVADMRLDPTMDPKDPDARHLTSH